MDVFHLSNKAYNIYGRWYDCYDDEKLALKISKKRAFGYNKSLNERAVPGLYDIDMLGWNYRMSEGHQL